jgi:site-specific recombinase XerD
VTTDVVLEGTLVGGAEVELAATRSVLERLRDGWLLEVCRSDQSLRAYRSDFDAWLAWCARCGRYPLEVDREFFSAWVRYLEREPSERTKRPLAEASLARRVSVISSFYGFAVDEPAAGVDRSPVMRRGRPKMPNVSTTVGLSRDEARAFRKRLEVESARDRAVVDVLLLDGIRSGELRELDIGSTGYDSGHVVLRVFGKGRKVRKVVMAAPAVASVGAYLEERAAAAGVPVGELDTALPLFVNAAGGRLTSQAVLRIVRRIARAAGIKSWERLSPHSLRHAFITLGLDAGVPIHEIADHVGHASVRTTQRYDRARGALARTPVHTLAAFIEPEG